MDIELKNSAEDDKNLHEISSNLSSEAENTLLPSSECLDGNSDRPLGMYIAAQSKPVDILNSIFIKSNMGNHFNLPILDANHSLMIKYQNDLKEHLLKLHQETDEQIYELTIALKNQKRDNDDIGKCSADLQKKMISYKKIISSLNSNIENITKEKENLLEEVVSTKEKHEAIYETYRAGKDKERELQKQIEYLTLQIVQLSQLQVDANTDSSIVKRAAEKTTKDKENLLIEKLRQDALIVKMETEKYNLCNKINLFKTQYAFKKEEAFDIRKVIIDADVDIENMHAEKVKLLQQWKFSIEALERRDKMCAILNENVQKYKDKLMALRMEETNCKKEVRKEFERNEQLTLQHLQLNVDINHLNNVTDKSKTRRLKLEEQHAFYEKILHSIDVEMEKLKEEKQNKKKELLHKIQTLEKLSIEFRKIEQEHAKVLHEKIVQTKATKQTEKLIALTREKVESLESKHGLKEGEDAKLRLKILNLQVHINSMEKQLAEIKEDVKEQDETIARSEIEIAQTKSVIDKKQKQLAELDKKLIMLVASAGGKELGPLEKEIANYKRDITDVNLERKKMEQEWLKFQKDMMKLSNEADAIFHESEILRTREAVLEEKKIRMEADIAKEEREMSEMEHNITQIKTDLPRLTMLLCHEKEQEMRLEHDTKFLKDDFYHSLKDAELEFSRKENEIELLRKERKKMLLQLMKIEKHTSKWEDKTCLAEETRKTLKSEEYAAEIETLNSEIRRLRNKCEKIKKTEDSLLKVLEKSALQHANLYVKGDLEQLKHANKPSKPFFTTKIERLKKKIHRDKKKLEDFKREIEEKQKKIMELEAEEGKKETDVKNFMEEINKIENHIEKMHREKWQNIIKLSFKHKKNKLLHLVKDGKYVCAIRNEELRESEVNRLGENLLTLKNIVEKFMTTYPSLKPNLKKVLDHIAVGLVM